MQEPKITEELIREHGINSDEYLTILQTLKREPSFTELGIISVMWSEHASYKNSIRLLKTLPKEGSAILAKAGEENAGVVDIGEGLAVSFKIESHNHPSAVEPYHGAATGVGGILRDIFTMGARPVAVLDSLRFGNPNDPQVKHLIREVVNGIADYGNCFGVPTVGGEVYFEDSYEGNPLVNAMAVGILKHEHMAKSSARGIGNLVVYVGAKTGRDGIHGATFASVELTEESEEKRTAVQVGDPFTEKLLLEATLEVIQQELVVAIQDMGAAGLTCSSSEMAGKTDVGIELDVAKVPKRETGMSSYEIMLSESQERMLIVIEPVNFAKLEAIFHKWDLSAVVIGKVTGDGLLRVLEEGVIKAELPARMLVLGGDAPVYTRETKRPAYLDNVQKLNLGDIPEPKDYNSVLKQLISSANLASKRPIFRQYDHMVQVNTIVEPGSDAAVIHVSGTRKALAMSTDCNGRYCYLDPYQGTMGAVAESARNVVCSGAKPLAITNCLNFGNPYKPEVYWTFSEAIKGMSDACRAFDTPVTGGNVSFYNENPKSAIYPTPTIGMLGLITDIDHILTSEFKEEGDVIILLGQRNDQIGGSEYLKTIHGIIAGFPPIVDLEQEKRLHKLVLALNHEGLLSSAHDCSDGGLVITIAESCFRADNSNLGAEIYINPLNRIDAEYFGESHGRIIISANPQDLKQIEDIIRAHEHPYMILGKVMSSNLIIDNNIFLQVDEIRQLWEKGLPL
jgi:phosphoribosylformylglycinamidine synthase subunit PurL